jgi:methyl-accepting chemotaxis protein
MVRDDVLISTGVDGLVKLVRDRGKIELRDAAVELGISQGILEEWARVLEKEGVIKIEYLFTKIYLTTPSAEKGEAQKKAKDIADMQVTMAREVETQAKRLERVGKELDDMRDEFLGVSRVFEEKMAAVRQKIKELDALEKQYEEMCFRCRSSNERFISDVEKLKKGVEESEKKLERLQQMGEELQKSIKVCSELSKSGKK